MHPVLFRLGPLTIHTYGALIACAFLVCIFLATREARRKGIDPDRVTDLGLYILIAAIAGSRILQVAVEYRYYMEHPAEIIQIWKGGLVFYGGFIAALFTSVWYLRKHSLPVWKMGDTLAPFIPLGQAIGRLGCFTAGCCYGAPTDLPWGVTFSDPDTLAVMGVPLHPTQLYESAGSLLIFVGLFAYRKRAKFEGQVFWLYVMLYSVLRFTVEFFRGDTERGFVHFGGFDISTSQAVGVVAFLTAVVMLSRLKAVGMSQAARN